MKARKIIDNVYWMGAVDWERRLFDSLIPLPDGTSYNAYLIQGSSKTALLDTVDPSKSDFLMAQLQDVKQLDYIVAHHAEQDHSGCIPQVLQKYPEAKLIVSPKGKGLCADHLLVDESRMVTVEDGETLDLGGKTLEFIHTPWVHWPETMCTYLKEDAILFSCDFFGSHLATNDLYVTNPALAYESAKRYYAEIMMPFRAAIRKNMSRLEPLEIRMIAPSHGPIFDRPALIMDAYADWISEAVKNEVVIPFISMHGSTRAMVNHLIGALTAHGITALPFDLAVTDLGKLAIALVNAATLVVGAPTVHIGPHPAVHYAAFLANALRPKLRYASVIGSYGWSSKAIEHIAGLIPNLKVGLLSTVLCRGYPQAETFAALDRLAAEIAEKHQAL